MTATRSATGDLASELFALLRETDPVHWKEDVADRARERWARIRARIDQLGASFEHARRPALRDAVEHVAELVKQEPADAEQHLHKGYWMALRARLMPAYERLAAQLRADSLPAPTLRPTNWSRIAFHVASALGALVLLEIVLTPAGTLWATGLFASTFWFLETGRALSERMNDRLMRVRFFQLIIHPHEVHRVNSATWYATALLALALFSPAAASAAALAVLGIGDPLAGLVGRRWGRRPLVGGRTLEGSIAFVLGGTVAAFGVLSLAHPVLGLGALLAISVAAAVAGAVAEVASRRVDDNMSVPLAAAAAATLVGLLLGVPL
jgi:dolichol kinase